MTGAQVKLGHPNFSAKLSLASFNLLSPLGERARVRGEQVRTFGNNYKYDMIHI